MFTEVRQAILPLALRRMKRRDDLGRAGLLIESLARHWRGRAPFELLIVAPRRDAQELRNSLPRFPNLDVSVRPESDFFAMGSSFYLMTGWYRQQIVKLQVPSMLGFGGFLTLDSDVCCVGDFDETTFIKNRLAISRWEPKAHHDWWRHVSKIVGVPFDAEAHGLSVTPNILHGDLTAQTLRHLRFGPFDGITSLCYWLGRKIKTVPWTEYSLYTSVAELKGNLFDYHAHWDPCYYADTQLFSRKSCVWAADDFERKVLLPNGKDPGGKFIIVQSHARIPIERVREYCLSFAG
ncbi:MAG: DUF6492 family protein [Reyranella sp.]|nr:DUF6492 family protein [Reyranella sp.]